MHCLWIFWCLFWAISGFQCTVSYDPKNLKIVDLFFISTALKTCVSQPLRKYQMSQVKVCQGGAALTIVSTRPLWISHQLISFKASHFPTREEMLLLKGLQWGYDYRLNTIKRYYTLNVWLWGKQLALFSQESWCFLRWHWGKHQDSQENKTN